MMPCAVVAWQLMAGLMHIPASIWQLLRGSSVVFVALMKHFGLHSPLEPSMWVGVGLIMLGVVCVGFSPMFSDQSESSGDGDGDVTFGILLTLAGTFMQSLQYAYEEKVMSGDNPAPPWLLIGMEGIYGSILVLLIVYPVAGLAPGNDHGVYEDLSNTLAQLSDSPTLVQLSTVFCFSVFVLNSFSVLVTFMLSSVWHAILDIFRPNSIWGAQLAIFYLGGRKSGFGEGWNHGSYLQLVGLVVILAGTFTYNGTIKVPGMRPTGDLLSKSDPRASPALTRSPLLTKNASPGSEFGSKGSPYAPRAQIANPSLKEKLVVKTVVSGK